MEGLRAAARQVDLEESFDSSRLLLDASEEVAAELGFPSPSKALLQRRRNLSDDSDGLSVQTGSKTPAEAVSPHEKENLAARRDERSVATETDEELLRVKEIRTPPGAVVEPKVEEREPRQLVEEMDDGSRSRTAGPPQWKYSEPPLSKKEDTHRSTRRKMDRLNAKESFSRFRPNTVRRRDSYQHLIRASSQSRASTHSESSRKLRDEDTVPSTRLSKLAKLINRLDQAHRSVDSESSLKRYFESTTQEQLCRSMMVISNPSSSMAESSQASRTSTKSLRHSIERLSRPKSAETVKGKMYALLDDQKNCTFRPKTARARSREAAEEDSKKFDFLDRQEAMERTRKQQLEFNRGKAEYDARIDKRVCPQCGSKQSYDEVKEKRKKCPNCRVEYGYRIDWSKVQSRFFTRVREYAAQQEEKKQKIILSILEGYKMRKKVYDSETGQITVNEIDPFNTTKWTDRLEAEFFSRLDEFMNAKRENLKKIEGDMYGTCTFKPSTTRRKTDTEVDSGYDPFRAFMERYEEDWERRLASLREEREKREKEKAD